MPANHSDQFGRAWMVWEPMQQMKMIVLSGPPMLEERIRKHVRWLERHYPEPKPAKPSASVRRKCREEAAGKGWTAREWNELVIKYDGKCLRCQSDSNPLVPDHVTALCEGGAHEIGNIQPLCYLCNIWKGIRTIDFRGKTWQ